MAFFVYLGLVDYDNTAGANADAQSAALADIRFEANHIYPAFLFTYVYQYFF